MRSPYLRLLESATEINEYVNGELTLGLLDLSHLCRHSGSRIQSLFQTRGRQSAQFWSSSEFSQDPCFQEATCQVMEPLSLNHEPHDTILLPSTSDKVVCRDYKQVLEEDNAKSTIQDYSNGSSLSTVSSSLSSVSSSTNFHNPGLSPLHIEVSDASVNPIIQRKRTSGVDSYSPPSKQARTRQVTENLICDACQNINFQKFMKLSPSDLHHEISKSGVLIAELQRRITIVPHNGCAVCNVLYQATHMQKRVRDPSQTFELRAYSYFQCTPTISFSTMDRHSRETDSSCLAVVPSGHSSTEYIMRSAPKIPLLFISYERQTRETMFNPLVISDTIDYPVIREWLRYCISSHNDCQKKGSPALGMKYLDCNTNVIVPAPENTPYVALSYVWGQPRANYNQNQDHTELKSEIPRTVQNAILVTKELGYKYLWVDKYCVSQNNDEARYEQIQQMATIYRNAEITLIAAAGPDAEYGLPGVGGTPRHTQAVADYGSFSIFSTVNNTHDSIWDSVWNTRGWTFQEAILSRRRLVFTEEQVYFECGVMNCFESVPPNLSLIHERHQRGKSHKFLYPGILSGKFSDGYGNSDKEAFSSLRIRDILLGQYSRKALTYPTDRLNAFTGIMKRFEERRRDLFHLWGVMCDLSGPNFFALFVNRLLWVHVQWYNLLHSSGFEQGTKRRSHERISTSRYKAPSWSWAGWTGKTIFPLQGISPDVTFVHGVTLESESQSRLSLEKFLIAMKLQPLQFSSPELSLYLDVDVIHPNSIVLESWLGRNEISVGPSSCEWHLSYGLGSPEEVYKLFQQGVCELLIINGSKHWRHCLVSKRIKNFSTRVGVCRAPIDAAKPPAVNRKTVCLR